VVPRKTLKDLEPRGGSPCGMVDRGIHEIHGNDEIGAGGRTEWALTCVEGRHGVGRDRLGVAHAAKIPMQPSSNPLTRKPVSPMA
jgi:hypothetical protein